MMLSGMRRGAYEPQITQTGAHRYTQEHSWPSTSSSSCLISGYTPRKPALAWYSADGTSADTLLDFGKTLRSLLVSSIEP